MCYTILKWVLNALSTITKNVDVHKKYETFFLFINVDFMNLKQILVIFPSMFYKVVHIN